MQETFARFWKQWADRLHQPGPWRDVERRHQWTPRRSRDNARERPGRGGASASDPREARSFTRSAPSHGNDPKTGPLNKFCQAHDVANLFVGRRGTLRQQRRQESNAHDHRARVADRRVSCRRNEEGQCLTSHDATCFAARRDLDGHRRARSGLAQEVHTPGARVQLRAADRIVQSVDRPRLSTLVRLTISIVPVENGKPGAVAPGRPRGSTCSRAKRAAEEHLHKGLAWIDEGHEGSAARRLRRATPSTDDAFGSHAYRRNQSPDSIRVSSFSPWRDE